MHMDTSSHSELLKKGLLWMPPFSKAVGWDEDLETAFSFGALEVWNSIPAEVICSSPLYFLFLRCIFVLLLTFWKSLINFLYQSCHSEGFNSLHGASKKSYSLEVGSRVEIKVLAEVELCPLSREQSFPLPMWQPLKLSKERSLRIKNFQEQ